MSIRLHKKTLYLNTSQIIALSFLGIIAVGTILLALPVSTRQPGSCGILTALFTATSAVCVTGLSLVDVWSTFSYFGQFIILLLMETGGLGFMSIISILFYITKHHNDIQSLSLIADSLGSDGLKHITRIQKRLLIGSFILESAGAIVLASSFVPSLGYINGIWFGIFHSVSAFCNAGFDLIGIIKPGYGLELIQGNNVALITIALLIIIGGIGFIVWDDIVTSRRIRCWSIYTKLVVLSTAILLVAGTVLFMFLEYNNPDTLGSMLLPDKITNAFFQSATPRTAGFASVNQSNLTDESIALTMMLMIIGGSAGSTAGGIKTVTFLIILCSVISSAFGRKNINVFHRTLSNEQISYSYTVASSFIILSLAGAFIISISSNASFVQSLYESISALATVGLSLGITGSLNVLSQLVLILFMYIGRVGLLNLTVGFFKAKESNAIKYPSVHLVIG